MTLLRPRTILMTASFLIGAAAMTVGTIMAQGIDTSANPSTVPNGSSYTFPSFGASSSAPPALFQQNDDVAESTIVPGIDSAEVFRRCMQAAVTRREQALAQVYQQYYQARAAARQQLAQELIAVWSIADRRERNSTENDVERSYRSYVRELNDHLDDAEDQIEDLYRDERRECERQRRDAERSERNSRRSSRSSSRSSRYSSAASFPGVDCQPYRCNDGTVFPSCTNQGYPINYLVHPCATHGG